VTPGSRIRKLREQQDLRQQELAQRAGVSLSFLSEIENDKRNPSGRVLLQIASALGTTMDYLLKGREPQPPPTREPVQIPPELAEAAERHGLSYRVTATLAQTYNQIVARRSSAPEHPPTPEEWFEMYQAMRKYIEN